MTQINIKRVYETPSSNDGYRVLVDRLWPRGMKREYLKYDYWAKELTPSNDLRKWFVKTFIDRIKPYEKVTLLYASKNQEQNHARVLAQYLSTLF